MQRMVIPVLSLSGESALRQYEQVLCEQEDLCHRFNYRMAQIMGHDSLGTTKLYI
jgi:hypothetical protein